EDSFPQRERTHSAFHRDLRGQRLHGNVENHAGAARSGFRWRGNRRSLSGNGGRIADIRRIHRGLHESAGGAGECGVWGIKRRGGWIQYNIRMQQSRRLTAIIEREGDGYVALCPELDIASQGDSLEESRANLI